MYQDSTQAQINEAVERAYQGFLTFRQLSNKQRADFMRAVASEIEALGASLIETAMQETHLPEPRLAGERGRTCMQLRQLADVAEEGSFVNASIETALPDRQPLPKPDIRNMLVPIGPVVVFGASNFVFAYSTAGVDPAAAWAAGCTVVVKAHPAHPKTSTMVAEAIQKAAQTCQMPEGTFEHVYGANFEVGKALVMHPRTAAVGFTGSLAGGRALFDMANQRPVPIPVFAEMGSTNPVFLLPNALQNQAEHYGKMYSGSITGSMGQFCTKPGLIFGISSDGLDRFINTLAEQIGQTAPADMLHGGIAAAYRKNQAQVVGNECVSVVASANDSENDLQGTPSLAVVSGDDFLKNPELHQEVFGPFALVIKCNDKAQMLAITAHLEGQLTSTIIGDEDDFSNNQDLFASVSLICGRLILNGIPTGVEVCAAMQHGGPYPASTDGRFGSVGANAITRFLRPLSYQNFPDNLLPDALKNENPLNIWRKVNSVMTSPVK